MSLLNKASLIQIPSGYKDGTLYSAKPTNGDGDFTFSRGSNLAATRVNSEGLIEKGRENLLLQSNSFDTTWGAGGGTLTSGQTGYDGSSDAWLFTMSSGANICNQTNTQSGVQTYSVYAKGSVNNGIRLYAFGSTNVNVYFNLNTGAVAAESNNIDASIEDVGSGWYRCSMTYNSTNTNIYLYLTNNSNSNAGSGSILIQDAQLEVGLVSTDVITTTTTTEQAGILEDMPRLDYSGGASCPSLLLEPQRSNIVTQSEALSLISATNSTITQNENVSPEGNQNGNLWTADVVTNGTVECQEQYSTSSGTTYTESWFVKYSGQQFVQLVTTSATFGAKYGNFDLINGIKGSGNFTDFSIEEYANSWYRISATETATSTGTGRLAGLRFISSLTAARGGLVTTDGSESIEIYGHQVEAGSYHTSYIPTYGAISTRSEDSCSKTGISSLIGQSEGTMYWEVDFGENDSSEYPAVFLYDGTSSNRILIQRRGNNQLLQYQVNAGGSNQVDEFSTSTVGAGKVKIAIAYKTNDFVLYLNGNQEASDTSGNTFSGAISQMSFQNLRHDRTSSLILFPTRLTNDELADLTTL